MEENNKEKVYTELIKSLMRQNRKQLKEMKIICLSCIISTMVITGSLVGGALYFFSTYAVEVENTITYEQQLDGNSSIINGNQYKDNAIQSDTSNSK